MAPKAPIPASWETSGRRDFQLEYYFVFGASGTLALLSQHDIGRIRRRLIQATGRRRCTSGGPQFLHSLSLAQPRGSAVQLRRLMKGDGQTSLHIGLGSGVAATALAKHGLAADIIELHPEVNTKRACISAPCEFSECFFRLRCHRAVKAQPGCWCRRAACQGTSGTLLFPGNKSPHFFASVVL